MRKSNLNSKFPEKKSKLLGQVLLRRRRVTDQQLEEALHYQQKYQMRLGDCLIHLRFTEELEIYKALAISKRLPFLSLDEIASKDVDPKLLKMLDLDLAKRSSLVPLTIRELSGRKRLVLATSEPDNFKLIEKLEFRFGLPVIVIVSSPLDIRHFIKRVYPQPKKDKDLQESETLMEMFQMTSYDPLDEESLHIGTDKES